MATAVLNKAQKEINKFTHHFAEGVHKASALVVTIELITDKKNVKIVNELASDLKKFSDNLPLQEKIPTIEKIQQAYSLTNGMLHDVSSFLSFINKIFNSECQIEMDEKIMLDFLAGLQKVEKELSYLSDFMALALKVQKEKKAEKKEISFAELLTYINAA